LKGDFAFSSPAWAHISPEGKDLVSQLLVVDPKKRLSATEALKHPWITGEAHSEMHDRHLKESTKRHAERVEEKRKRENRKR